MMAKRLSIGSDLQIYFDDSGRAKYSSVSGASLAAVEEELNAWQGFVAEWLERVEVPKTKRSSLAQQQIQKRFTPLAKKLRADWGMTPEEVKDVLLQPKFWQRLPEECRDLSEEQVEVILELVAGS